MLVVVYGLPGSGKRYFASRLAKRLGATCLSSDALRKKLIEEPRYSREEKARVYARLLVQADENLRTGQTVVLDATFHTASRRRQVTQLVAGRDVALRWIEVFAAEPILRARLARDRPDSDADYAVYEKLKRGFEPMTGEHLRLESTQTNLAEMLECALEYLGA
jgi:predicted kinase